MLRARMEYEVAEIVEFPPSAKWMWDKLKAYFVRHRPMAVQEIRFKMSFTRMAEDQDIEDHLLNLEQLQNKLKALGQPLSDWDYSYQIAMSLPPSW